jgi:hypothetical protein
MTNVFARSFTLLAVAAAIAIAAIAWPASAQSGDARVRVLHASPDAPAVDVYVDGTEAISNLAFESITDYVTLPAGDHQVEVFPASANGTGDPVIDATLTLTAGKDYTVAAAGLLADIEPVVLEDNNAAPAAGQAHLRVVHLSPDAPNVDIYAEGAGVVVSNLPFKEAADYLPLNAGTYNLEVRVAGTQTVALELPGVALEAGKVYSAFALGLAAGDPALEVKLTVDATAPAATAAPTPAPTATAAPGLPSTGGPPTDGGMSTATWLLIAGATVVVIGLATASGGLIAELSRRK